MPRLNCSKREQVREARAMQRTSAAAVAMLDKDLRETDDKISRARIAASIGSIVGGWVKLQDALRVLKGQPLPGSFKPEPPLKKQTRSAQLLPGPTE